MGGGNRCRYCLDMLSLRLGLPLDWHVALRAVFPAFSPDPLPCSCHMSGQLPNWPKSCHAAPFNNPGRGVYGHHRPGSAGRRGVCGAPAGQGHCAAPGGRGAAGVRAAGPRLLAFVLLFTAVQLPVAFSVRQAGRAAHSIAWLWVAEATCTP